MKMNKEVLFLTDSYYYSPSPNGLCIERICKVLISRNIKVSVIAMRNQFSKQYEKISGVDVYRVPAFPEWEMIYNKDCNYIYTRIKNISCKMKRMFMLPFHPLRSLKVKKGFVNMSKKLIEEKNISTIVAVYRDAEETAAGLFLKRLFPNINLIIYTLDSIEGGCVLIHI